MDWSVPATMFAAASLFAIVWQVVRAETIRAPLGWTLDVRTSPVVENDRWGAEVRFAPTGQYVVHEVDAHVWGSARLTDLDLSPLKRGVVHPETVPRLDCTDLFVVDVDWAFGDGEAYVGFSWIRPTFIRRTPVRHTIRVHLGQDRDAYLWKWYRVPRRKGRPQGRWVRNNRLRDLTATGLESAHRWRRYRRLAVPDT